MKNIIIATIKEWNIENFYKLKSSYSKMYNFHLITSNEELDVNYINNINPKYIFFLHWSWFIPASIYENYECVVFHMTDLPYGRGGSPLQNLIINEQYETKISALRVDDGLDTGDIYYKESVNISIGSAEEIFTNLSVITFDKIIPKFLTDNLVAKPQIGEVTTFKRRKPEQSNIDTVKNKTISKMYDFIRMLDAPGYPKAFAEIDKLKVEFSECHFKNGKLVGRFEISENE